MERDEPIAGEVCVRSRAVEPLGRHSLRASHSRGRSRCTLGHESMVFRREQPTLGRRTAYARRVAWSAP